ncbi:L-rhamnose mutarotase [Streptomyces sp. NBC_01320]|uniref:L-rhamnose mutarotase n=1 Tax=Streptomyces sp. NBC_01320 TaxID=2903824 RepID=UPI003FA34C69
MNTDELEHAVYQAERKVLKIQTKLHCWARGDPHRRFGDLFNLVADPAFLLVAWDRVLPEKLDEYRELHRRVPAPVLDRLRACHVANYSIHELGDRLFAYFEYHGDDLAADLALMAADESTQA